MTQVLTEDRFVKFFSKEIDKHNAFRAAIDLPPVKNWSRYLAQRLRKGRNNFGIFIDMVRTGHDRNLLKDYMKIRAQQVKTAELQELRIAEERDANKTEIVQTKAIIKSGWVYIVEHSSFPGWVKIGSAMNTEERLKSYQTYTPDEPFLLVDRVFSEDRRVLETAVHHRLADVRGNGEWFKIDLVSAKKTIRQVNKTI